MFKHSRTIYFSKYLVSDQGTPKASVKTQLILVLFSNTSGSNFSVLVEAPPHLSMYPQGTSQDGENGKRDPEATSGTESRKQVSGGRRRGNRKGRMDRGEEVGEEGTGDQSDQGES